MTVSVWLAARKSKVLSIALNLKLTAPEPEPVLSLLTEVVSADASTVLSPLGSVAPPDQIAETKLLPTVCVSEVDVGEGERARSDTVVHRVAGLAREFNDRVRPRVVGGKRRRPIDDRDSHL